MADISKVTLPSGTTYNLKDAQARSDIEEIRGSIAGGVSFLGITSTALTDGAAINPIVIDGNSVPAFNGDIAIYGDNEFIFSSSDSKWHKLGPAGEFKALAYKDTATANYTPTGSVSTPTVTIDPSTETVNSITGVGSLPSWAATVSNETLSFSWSTGSLPTKGADQTVITDVSNVSVAQPTFTGTQATITVS